MSCCKITKGCLSRCTANHGLQADSLLQAVIHPPDTGRIAVEQVQDSFFIIVHLPETALKEILPAMTDKAFHIMRRIAQKQSYLIDNFDKVIYTK